MEALEEKIFRLGAIKDSSIVIMSVRILWPLLDGNTACLGRHRGCFYFLLLGQQTLLCFA